MNRSLIFASIALFGLLNQGSNNPVTDYVRTLNSAQGLTVSYTVNVIGNGRRTFSVELAKPNHARIDSDSDLVVADGKTITRFNKSGHWFIRTPQSDSNFESLFDSNDLSTWSGFFRKDAFASAVVKPLGNKERKGESYKVFEASVPDSQNVATIYLGAKDGLAHVVQTVEGDPSNATTTILDVSSISLSPVGDSKFAFTPPADARETSEAEALYASKVEGEPIPDGSGSIHVKLSGVDLLLYTYRPANYKKGLFMLVFHGIDRHPEGTRDRARVIADKCGALVLAPDFETSRFDDAAYQSGGVYGPDRKLAPESKWTFSRIPELIFLVRKLEGRFDMPVFLIGHSAGGQFVGRLASLLDVGAVRYVATNPSAWVFPTTKARYGYGLGGLPSRYSSDAAIRRYLAQPLSVLLGQSDVLSQDLDVGAGAMAQGPTRIERGRAFFKAGQDMAGQLGCPFNWKLYEVPNVGHNEFKMYSSPQAMQALFGDAGNP